MPISWQQSIPNYFINLDQIYLHLVLHYNMLNQINLIHCFSSELALVYIYLINRILLILHLCFSFPNHGSTILVVSFRILLKLSQQYFHCHLKLTDHDPIHVEELYFYKLMLWQQFRYLIIINLQHEPKFMVELFCFKPIFMLLFIYFMIK